MVFQNIIPFFKNYNTNATKGVDFVTQLLYNGVAKMLQREIEMEIRLKEIRESRNLKVSDIAKVLHTSQRQVRLWESGERKMKMSKYIVLAKYYNVSLDYFAGLTDIPLKLKDDI